MTQAGKKKSESKKRRPRRSATPNMKGLMPFLPFIVPLVVTAFIYTWQYTRSNIVGMPIEDLQAEKKILIRECNSLRLRIEERQAPNRIEAIARKKLGMITPEKWQVVSLDEPATPPSSIYERNTQVQERLPSGHQRVGLFGFLKKREDLGMSPLQQVSKKAERQSI